MALPELFKVKQKRYIGNGKRCKKTDPGAVETVTKSEDWYADIKPSESAGERIDRRKAGLPALKRKRVKLCIDKRAAQNMLAEIIAQGERNAAGLKNHRAEAHQDLGELVSKFERHLFEAGEKRTADYIKTTLSRIQRVFDECRIYRLSDIDCEKIESWLFDLRNDKGKQSLCSVKGSAKTYQDIADAFDVSITTVTYWRQKGAPITPRTKNSLAEIAKWHAKFTLPKNIGSTTNDHYITALKRFGNWMTNKAEVVTANPFSKLDKMNDDTELRKQRRIIEPEQFAALVTAASQSKRTYRGLNGIDRSMIYVLACYTGLRAGEIGTLQPNSFDFGPSPTVTVKAAYTKSRKTARQPLKAELAERLKEYVDSKPRATVSTEGVGGLVWPGEWTERRRR